MLFVIHGLDKEGYADVRQDYYSAHRAYIADAAKFGVKIVMSGPLVTDTGTPTGSLLIIEAPTRAEAEAFRDADPFYQAQLWDRPTLAAFDKKNG